MAHVRGSPDGSLHPATGCAIAPADRAHAGRTGGYLPRPGPRHLAATDQLRYAPSRTLDRESGGTPGTMATAGIPKACHGRRSAIRCRDVRDGDPNLGVAWRHTFALRDAVATKLGAPVVASSRSPAGSARRILMIRPCACRTKRSISACSSKADGVLKKALQAQSPQRHTIRLPRTGGTEGGRATCVRGRLDSGAASHRATSVRSSGHW